MRSVCIIGGGPAGLTLADSLSNFIDPQNIVILEAGGIEEPNTLAAEFVSIGSTEYKPIRQFMLGGHGHLWGGACPRLHPDDFVMKSKFGLYDDWPISYDDLEEYYMIAEELLNVFPNQKQNIEIDQTSLNLSLLNKGRLGWLPRGEQSYFTNTLLPRVLSKGVDIRTWTTVQKIVLDNVGEKPRVRYWNKAAEIEEVEVDVVVLAAGGLSNARLLQLSASDMFPGGLGNQNGNLGLYHMDHPRVVVTLSRFGSYGEKNIFADSTLFPSSVSIKKVVSTENPKISYASLTELGVLTAEINEQRIERLLSSLGDEESGLDARIRSLITFENKIVLDFEVMEPPLRENALNLAKEVDIFGDPKLATNVNIDLVRNDIFNLLIDDLNATFDDLGFRVSDFDDQNGWTGQHPSGSTRMAKTSSDGVVDENLRVFGTSNVYVLGSSVFTTGGYANPTLTIVALALRLANHLKDQ